MKQFMISINKKWGFFLVYLVVIGIFSILYYNAWEKDDKCFVINEKLNPLPAKIIRENLCAAILSKPDELPYEEKRLKELLNKYLMYNKEIDEKFSKSNAIVANEAGQYITRPVEVEGGLEIASFTMYHTMPLYLETFKTLFVPDDAVDIIENQESDKMLPKDYSNSNLIKQINLFEDIKNCFSNAKAVKQVFNFVISNSTLDHKIFQGLQTFIDLVLEEIDKNEVVLDAVEDSLDDYWERLPDKTTPSITCDQRQSFLPSGDS